MKTTIIICIILLTFFVPAWSVDRNESGRTTALGYTEDTYINANNILMFITNYGELGQDLNEIFNLPTGTYFPYTGIEDIISGANNKTCVYTTALWIGGTVDGQVRMASARYDQQSEYRPGPMSGGTFQPDDPSFKVYKLYADSLAGTPNADYTNWPVDQGAPIREDGTPDMMGNQMLWAVYNDADSTLQEYFGGDTLSLGLEVRQTVWAYDLDWLSNCIFFRFRIFNKGANDIDSCYLGYWCDVDIGRAEPGENYDKDDLTACDTTRNLGYGYNSANWDYLYGSMQPAVGIDLLRGPIVETGNGGDEAHFWDSVLTGYQNVEMTSFTAMVKSETPNSPEMTYNYLRGLHANGSRYDVAGDSTPFWYAGDPVAGTGDIQATCSDMQILNTTGPVSLPAGDSTELIYVLVFGRGDNRLASITEMMANDLAAQELYDNDFVIPSAWHVSTDGSDETGDGSLTAPLRNIQTALNGAEPGDSIIVHPGTYSRSLYVNKAVVMVPYDTTSRPVLEAEPGNRVLFIEDFADTMYLSGFEVTGGNPDSQSQSGRGGGILIDSAAVVIENCDIHHNESTSGGDDAGGGGVCFYYGGYVVLRNSIIRDNISTDGGGILSSTDAAGGVLENNIISNNYSYDAGGGVFLYNATTVNPFRVIGNTIVGNRGAKHGFGFQSFLVDVDFERNLVTDNGPIETCECDVGYGISIGGYNVERTVVTCNDVYGNCGDQAQSNPNGFPYDVTNLIEDPLLCDLEGGDFHLSLSSPCAADNNDFSVQIGALGIYIDPDMVVAADRNSTECGTSIQCHVYEYDCTGIEINLDSAVQWLSRDHDVVLVSTRGLINPVAPGQTYVVAAGAGHEPDSVLFTVLPTLYEYNNDTLFNHANNVALKVNVSGSPDEVWLIYRQGGGHNRDSVIMTAATGQSYTGSIPSGVLGLRSIEYCFRAVDNGVSNTLPNASENESWFYFQVEIPNTTDLFEIVPWNYQMVGFSMNPSSLVIDSILKPLLGDNNDGFNFRFGCWNPTLAAYDEYPELDSLLPYHGYWLISRSATTVHAHGYSTVPDVYIDGQGYARLILAPGWNQIVNPFAFDVDWGGRIEDTSYGDYIENGLHAYSPARRSYSSTTLMEQFRAYFVRNVHPTDSLELLIPYDEYTELKTTVPFAEHPGSWFAEIAAANSDGQRSTCWIGVSPVATAGSDSLDFSSPPAISTSLKLDAVCRQDNKTTLASDIRATSDSILIWTMQLSGEAHDRVIMQTDQMVDLPKGIEIAVFDRSGVLLGTLSETETVDLMLDATGNRTLLVQATLNQSGQSDSEHDPTVPARFDLNQNYPNPFNASTSIGFDLAQPGRVRLSVYNILGRSVIRLVDCTMAAGHYVVDWDGTAIDGKAVASGVYFYRLDAGGQVFERKMILLK
ncbi:MAG TPA: T9SS type A sorting domain-containing protein [candidate division Zixibacteria bacterium]|nr:T9SS type A sorting domain-containing protein [candidate division Zixibacteria bacterium]